MAVHHRRRSLPLDPPPPTHQSDHREKQQNLPLGESGRAIFGTQSFGSQTPPPPNAWPRNAPFPTPRPAVPGHCGAAPLGRDRHPHDVGGGPQLSGVLPSPLEKGPACQQPHVADAAGVSGMSLTGPRGVQCPPGGPRMGVRWGRGEREGVGAGVASSFPPPTKCGRGRRPPTNGLCPPLKAPFNNSAPLPPPPPPPSTPSPVLKKPCEPPTPPHHHLFRCAATDHWGTRSAIQPPPQKQCVPPPSSVDGCLMTAPPRSIRAQHVARVDGSRLHKSGRRFRRSSFVSFC